MLFVAYCIEILVPYYLYKKKALMAYTTEGLARKFDCDVSKPRRNGGARINWLFCVIQIIVF